MNKCQEALNRLKDNNYLTSREKKDFVNILQELVDKETKLEYENKDLMKSINNIIDILKAHYGFQIIKRKHNKGNYILNVILTNGMNHTVYLTDDESSKLIQANMIIKNIANNEMFYVRK